VNRQYQINRYYVISEMKHTDWYFTIARSLYEVH